MTMAVLMVRAVPIDDDERPRSVRRRIIIMARIYHDDSAALSRSATADPATITLDRDGVGAMSVCAAVDPRHRTARHISPSR